MAIVRGIHRFDGRSTFATWVYRVSTNAALDEMRRRRRRPVPGVPEEHQLPEGGLTAAPRGAHSIQPDRVDAVVARLDVDQALRGLPEDQRAAVVLRDLLDLDYAEIAEILDVPVGTVRSRISRGRAAIAEGMRETAGNHTPVAERPTSGTTPGTKR